MEIIQHDYSPETVIDYLEGSWEIGKKMLEPKITSNDTDWLKKFEEIIEVKREKHQYRNSEAEKLYPKMKKLLNDWRKKK
jgi:hypothetical protein